MRTGRTLPLPAGSLWRPCSARGKEVDSTPCGQAALHTPRAPGRMRGARPEAAVGIAPTAARRFRVRPRTWPSPRPVPPSTERAAASLKPGAADAARGRRRPETPLSQSRGGQGWGPSLSRRAVMLARVSRAAGSWAWLSCAAAPARPLRWAQRCVAAPVRPHSSRSKVGSGLLA